MEAKRSEVWPAKLRACGMHFVVTVLVAACAAGLVYGVWYPPPLAQMLGVTQLFALLLVCDVVLGPLMSLVIYHPQKSRRMLRVDYAVIGVIQVAALLYGLFSVYQARPIFLVWTVDRYAVVTASELAPSALKALEPTPWQPAWWKRYHTVYVAPVQDFGQKFDLINSALAGGQDLQHVTANYRAVQDHQAAIFAAAQPLQNLQQRYPEHRSAFDAVVQAAGLPAAQLRAVPVQAKRHDGPVFATAVMRADSAQPVGWLQLDPF